MKTGIRTRVALALIAVSPLAGIMAGSPASAAIAWPSDLTATDAVDLSKEVEDIERTGENAYTVSYTLTYTSTDPTGPAIWDRLRFADGVTVESATATAVSPADLPLLSDWDGTTQVQLLDEESSMLTEATITITVEVQVPDDLTVEEADCTLAESETVTGLRNEAAASVSEDFGDNPNGDVEVPGVYANACTELTPGENTPPPTGAPDAGDGSYDPSGGGWSAWMTVLTVALVGALAAGVLVFLRRGERHSTSG